MFYEKPEMPEIPGQCIYVKDREKRTTLEALLDKTPRNCDYSPSL
jgi:hypothetical protein